ncbi:MAG TPA: tetratricopeptide repeat protein [Puia sp.]|jgi:tetratricopeptide (TPR) repeat protein
MKNKMRFSLLVAGVASLCNVAFAQSVDQGKKFLYYERYKSANDVFDKILASNPNNIDAVYWKGQTLLSMKDSAAAGDLYSKALQTNGNAPLLLAGMGGVELRMHKTADAKARFETALSLSKNKDIEVLNAVANANIDARDGDAAYAIEKLNLATQVKKFNDPDTYLLLGDAYRKQIDGGNAVQSYQKALTIDPKLAEAKFKIGKIYETQNNKEFFLQAFEDAIQMDPNYGPAFHELYYYWYNRDVNKAADYLAKYIAVSDPGPELDYATVDQYYVSAKFPDAKTKALSIISTMGDKANPRMYKMVAYVNDTLGDLAGAKQYIDLYFTKQDPAAIVPADYEERGHIKGKSTDSTVALTAFDDYKQAILLDTLPESKAKYAAEASDLAKKMGNKKAMAEVAGIAYNTKKNPVNTDLYNWGMANYQAGNYKTADSIFCGIYESKYPTEIYGYLWCARSKVAQDDSVGSNGYAVEAYQKLAQVARGLDSTAKAAGTADSTKYRAQVINSYSQLAGYYNNIKKDKESALLYLNKILEVDPANADAAKFIGILKKAAEKQQERRSTGTAKPKAGGAK